MKAPSQPEPAIEQTAIELAGVNLSLGQGAARVHILKGIDLNIGSGEAIGLVGPSGSGKSTLLRLMSGVARPRTGQVLLSGQNLQTYDREALARQIAVVPQESRIELPFSAQRPERREHCRHYRP